jgi:hypothetical protein
MATATTYLRSHAGEIKFEYGVPQVFALKFLEPKPFDGSFGTRGMFTAADEGYGERKIWMDWEAASNLAIELKRLGIQVGEAIRCVKVKHARGGGHGYTVARAAQTAPPEWVTREEAPPAAPAPIEAQLERSLAMVRQHGPQVFRQPAPAAVEAEAIAPGAGSLAGALKAAVDAALECTVYAARKGMELAFSEESIRTLAITAFINSSAKGGR